MGIRRSSADGRLDRVARASSLWRITVRVAAAPSSGGCGAGLANRKAYAGDGWKPFRSGTLCFGRRRRTDLSNPASLAHDERVRAAHLDGMCLAGCARDQYRNRTLLVVA